MSWLCWWLCNASIVCRMFGNSDGTEGGPSSSNCATWMRSHCAADMQNRSMMMSAKGAKHGALSGIFFSLWWSRACLGGSLFFTRKLKNGAVFCRQHQSCRVPCHAPAVWLHRMCAPRCQPPRSALAGLRKEFLLVHLTDGYNCLAGCIQTGGRAAGHRMGPGGTTNTAISVRAITHTRFTHSHSFRCMIPGA